MTNRSDYSQAMWPDLAHGGGQQKRPSSPRRWLCKTRKRGDLSRTSGALAAGVSDRTRLSPSSAGAAVRPVCGYQACLPRSRRAGSRRAAAFPCPARLSGRRQRALVFFASCPSLATVLRGGAPHGLNIVGIALQRCLQAGLSLWAWPKPHSMALGI